MKLRARMGGIQFAGDEVRLAVVKTGGKAPVLLEVHAARAVYSDPEGRTEALVLALQDVAGRVKNKPSLYVLCESSQAAIARNLTVPFKGAKVGAAVPFELEQFVAFPLEQLVVDHCAVREAAGNTDVVAVALRRALIEENLAVLTAANVEAESIGLDAAGLAALWAAGRKSAAGLHATIHVQDTGSVMMVMHNKKIAYIRPLPWTPASFAEQPAAAGREVQNSIRAFQSQWKGEDPVVDLTVTGVDVAPAERDAFEGPLQVPVVYESLLNHIKGGGLVDRGPTADEDHGHALTGESRWAGVIGVATAGAGGASTFEFRKGDLAPEGTGRMIGAHAIFSAALVLFAAFGFALYCYLDYRQNMGEIHRIGDQIWNTYAETFPQSALVAAGRPPSDVGGSESALAMEEEANKLLGEGPIVAMDTLKQPTLLDILQEIAKSLPPERILVNDVSVRSFGGRGQSVKISGEVIDPAGQADVTDPFKQSPILQVDGTPLQKSRNNKSEFIIQANVQAKDQNS